MVTGGVTAGIESDDAGGIAGAGSGRVTCGVGIGSEKTGIEGGVFVGAG